MGTPRAIDRKALLRRDVDVSHRTLPMHGTLVRWSGLRAAVGRYRVTERVSRGIDIFGGRAEAAVSFFKLDGSSSDV